MFFFQFNFPEQQAIIACYSPVYYFSQQQNPLPNPVMEIAVFFQYPAGAMIHAGDMATVATTIFAHGADYHRQLKLQIVFRNAATESSPEHKPHIYAHTQLLMWAAVKEEIYPVW